MNTNDCYVPKVHPATREMETDDPMELFATPALGDPEVMLDCIAQEFAGMGWAEEQLAALFHSPDYPVLMQLWELFGEAGVRRRLREILARQGTFQVRESFVDLPDADELEPELIQIAVRS